MIEYLMYTFEDQMRMFGYLSLVSSHAKLDWTYTFDTYCMCKPDMIAIFVFLVLTN